MQNKKNPFIKEYFQYSGGSGEDDVQYSGPPGTGRKALNLFKSFLPYGYPVATSYNRFVKKVDQYLEE